MSSPKHLRQDGDKIPSNPSGLKQESRCARWTQRLVILEDNQARRLWNTVLYAMLGYTATLLPYDLAFFDFAVPLAVDKGLFWVVLEQTVDILFVIDLFTGFFFTYHDERGREVTNMCRIVKRYLRTWFALNLVACIPSNLIGDLILEVAGSDTGGDVKAHKVLRVTRLERVSRLTRLARLLRISKLIVLTSHFWDWLWSFRAVRIVNFIAGLTWAAHMVACGWYIVASLHDDWTLTWIHARFGDIREPEPFFHWLTSVYFVLTVFTSVGFGDISANTASEVVYAMFAMLVGCMCNGIIISEIINIITEVDRSTKELHRQKEIVESFSDQAQLRNDCSKELIAWASSGRHGVAARHDGERKQMKQVFLGNMIPHKLVAKVPTALFKGELIKNRFVSHACLNLLQVPYRLPMMLAMDVKTRYIAHLETVYHSCDYDWNIYLVFEGIFSSVAKPSNVGGIAERSDVLAAAQNKAFHEARDFQSLPLQPVRRFSSDHLEAKKNKGTGDHKCDTFGYSPFELYGIRNYFGDVELIMRNQKGRRRSCKRCESKEGGTLLVLAYSDLQDVVAQFPTALSAWTVIAAQRDAQHAQRLRKLTTAIDYQNLAAWIIQWHFLEHLRKQGDRSEERRPKLWGVDVRMENNSNAVDPPERSLSRESFSHGAINFKKAGKQISPEQLEAWTVTNREKLEAKIDRLSLAVTGIHDDMSMRTTMLEQQMEKMNSKLDALMCGHSHSSTGALSL